VKSTYITGFRETWDRCPCPSWPKRRSSSSQPGFPCSRRYVGSADSNTLTVTSRTVAVSLRLAGEKDSGCIGLRLYLPEAWASSSKLRAEAGVPREVKFQKKWQLALKQVDKTLKWGVRKHVVLADAGYGDCRKFRDGVRHRGLHYLVGVQGGHKVGPPGAQPQQPAKGPGKKGRPRTRYVADGTEPWAIEVLVSQFPKEQWKKVSWHEGSKGE
jgi:SRSO17 transposase